MPKGKMEYSAYGQPQETMPSGGRYTTIAALGPGHNMLTETDYLGRPAASAPVAISPAAAPLGPGYGASNAFTPRDFREQLQTTLGSAPTTPVIREPGGRGRLVGGQQTIHNWRQALNAANDWMSQIAEVDPLNPTIPTPPGANLVDFFRRSPEVRGRLLDWLNERLASGQR